MRNRTGTLKPGDLLIMDNLRPHKATGVRAATEAAGASVMFIPSYSPNLNRIEMAFSKPKALLRARATRTLNALDRPSRRRHEPAISDTMVISNQRENGLTPLTNIR
jgi:transposase